MGVEGEMPLPIYCVNMDVIQTTYLETGDSGVPNFNIFRHVFSRKHYLPLVRESLNYDT